MRKSVFTFSAGSESQRDGQFLLLLKCFIVNLASLKNTELSQDMACIVDVVSILRRPGNFIWWLPLFLHSCGVGLLSIFNAILVGGHFCLFMIRRGEQYLV